MVLGGEGQGDVGGHAHGEIFGIGAEADFEGFDVAFGAADVALGGEVGIDGAVENFAGEFFAGGEADGEGVADVDAVDVGFFDIGADPEVVGVEDGDDGLAGVDDFAFARGADVDDAVGGGEDLGVGEEDLGLVFLGGGGGGLVDHGFDGGFADGDLLLRGFGQLDRRLGGDGLFFQRFGVGFLALVVHAGLVVNLERFDAFVVGGLFVLESEAGVFLVGDGFGDLGAGGGEVGGGLVDLVLRLQFLVTQIGLGLGDLCRGLLLRTVVKIHVGLPLAGLDGGEELAFFDDVAFLDEEFVEAALHLGVGDDAVGGDDAGERDFGFLRLVSE